MLGILCVRGRWWKRSFSQKTSIFRLKLDLSLVNIERERGEGMPARVEILSVGGMRISAT